MGVVCADSIKVRFYMPRWPKSMTTTVAPVTTTSAQIVSTTTSNVDDHDHSTYAEQLSATLTALLGFYLLYKLVKYCCKRSTTKMTQLGRLSAPAQHIVFKQVDQRKQNYILDNTMDPNSRRYYIIGKTGGYMIQDEITRQMRPTSYEETEAIKRRVEDLKVPEAQPVTPQQTEPTDQSYIQLRV